MRMHCAAMGIRACGALLLLCALTIPCSGQDQKKAFGTRRVQNGTELLALLNSLTGSIEIDIELDAGGVYNISEAPPRYPVGSLTGGFVRLRGPPLPAKPALLDFGGRFSATVRGGRAGDASREERMLMECKQQGGLCLACMHQVAVCFRAGQDGWGSSRCSSLASSQAPVSRLARSPCWQAPPRSYWRMSLSWATATSSSGSLPARQLALLQGR